MIRTPIIVMIAWAICAVVGVNPSVGMAAGWAPPATPDKPSEVGDGFTNAAKPAASDAPPFPNWPGVRLAAVPGFDDDAARDSSTLARIADLSARIKSEPDLRKGVDLQLAAVNLILSRQLEPECTRWLLRLPDRPDRADGNSCADALARAEATPRDDTHSSAELRLTAL